MSAQSIDFCGMCVAFNWIGAHKRPVRRIVDDFVTLGGTLIGKTRSRYQRKMEELIRTNDIVLISFVEALLKDAGIPPLVVDQNMSVIEGSIGVLPRRILVPADQAEEARRLLTEADIGSELERPGKKS